MEKQSRKARNSASSNEVKKPSSETTFEAFFNKCVFEGKLKFWQKLEIATFFKDDLKLREKEDQETYETALAKY